MSRYARLLLVLILTATATIVHAAKVSVVVKEASEIKGADIKIGDMATFRSQDKDLVEKISEAVVCRSPLPGRSFKVSRAQVISAIRRANVDETSVNLTSPEQVTVTRTSAAITSQMLFDTVQDYVLNHATWPGTMSVENVRTSSDQSIPEGNLELRANPTNHKLRKGRNSIDVDIVVDDTVYARTQVPVYIRITSPVLVATKPIGRSEAITSENAAIQEQDVTNLSDDILTAMPTVDSIAQNPISEGSIVRQNQIMTPFTICTGDSVIVLVTSDNISVAEKGVAQANGRKGDKISIKLPGDDRIVNGTVVEPGVAKIAIGGRN